uniref:Armadillo like helical domain containing 1 n=1 Tax=Oryzias melastigma TaxID=30732 RepID=A0A3B3BGT7_ORYME
MSSPEEQANLGRALGFLCRWDRGDGPVRVRLLRSFLSRHARKTFYELEVDLAQTASLLLARITVWMRVSFQSEGFLALQLKALGVFLSASNHDQYLVEFLEAGGVVTLLDVLRSPQVKEDDKAAALRLLLNISDAGRKYKEFICENNGVEILSDCMVGSDVGDPAGALLESLSHGNPKYQEQIYQSLIGLLTRVRPRAQLLLLQTLRSVQLKRRAAHRSIVAPLLNTLKSLHLDVQEEACHLIRDLKGDGVKAALLSGLVALLKPVEDRTEEPEVTGSLSLFVQQAAAAKAIRFLAEEDEEFTREFLSLGAVPNLLYATGNREHPEAQIQASLALKHFVRSDPSARAHVRRVMGGELFAAFTNKPDSLHMEMDERRAEVLLSNRLIMDPGLDDKV